MNKILFNHSVVSKNTSRYINECLVNFSFENSQFTKKAKDYISGLIGSKATFLTNSCTAALELAALLLDIKQGDEVIMPSYSFVSLANAFVLRGAIPVFVDIRPDTLNIDETLIEAAITPKTKAICVVHYAGVGCEMEQIVQIAKKHNLFLIEDNAQGIGASYRGKPLGSFGHMSTLSFHHTKNITSGLGGALVINDERFVKRAKVMWQKGTNREEFLEGKIDKYTWVDLGSSFMPSEMTAALLYSQLEELDEITHKRLKIWHRYHSAFGTQNLHQFVFPAIPTHCQHNGHIYYLILPSPQDRDHFMTQMKEKSIETTTHFVPLHISPGGKQYGKFNEEHLSCSEYAYQRLVRLPIYPQLTDDQVDYIIQSALYALTFCSK